MTASNDSRGARGPRILITGGGTGGHVYPGLAVAEALRLLAPAADIRFAGSGRGMESVLVPRAGWPFCRVPASGLRGLGWGARFRFLGNFLRGFAVSLGLLLLWRPAVVLGTGGYVSAPVMAAARALRVPCVLQEQNAIPGSTNRLVGRWSRRIYLGFAAAAARFAGGARTVATGNPVRAAFAGPGRPAAASPDRRRLLVFGGSGGAGTLNRALAAAAPALLARRDLDLWLQTGPADLARTQAAFAGAEAPRVRVTAYIEDMPAALAWAELVVCRAGAMTLAELQAVGRPAVLVPFPHATDDHQTRNAEDCAAAGAALVLADARCDGPTLTALLEELLADRGRLASMAAAARALGRPAAARTIAADILELIGHPAGLRATEAPPSAGPSPAREEDTPRVP